VKSYSELLQIINKKISETSYGSYPNELYEPISYMMSLGGKRLRPVLTLMACDMFGSNIEKALNAALAVEVFHNFTLVHDDIMDNAPLRRGKETIYKKWNMPVAILAGDLMMIKATDFLCETESTDLKSLVLLFNKTAREVCEGQQIDMNFEVNENVSHEEYIQMISLKTAVLLGASLQIGALIGGASSEASQHLYDFGKNIGIAFQIQDDILDSFGDGSQTGKQVGGDISSNKKTLLLIELLESAHKDDKKYMLELFKELDQNTKITEVLKLYDKYQIRDFAESKKQTYLDIAMKHLLAIGLEKEKTEILEKTALDLMERMS
jgi:geranylgeranyl diphosphate synthase type II